MKKILFISFCFIFFSALTAKAQFYAGGSFAILGSSTFEIGGVSITTNKGGLINIAPEVGYNLNGKWAVGGKASMLLVGGGSILSFSPYSRLTFYRNNAVSLFADGGVDFTWTDPNMYYGVGITPGILFKATPHFSFFGKYGYIGYSETPLNTTKGISLSSNDINIGFYYNF